MLVNVIVLLLLLFIASVGLTELIIDIKNNFFDEAVEEVEYMVIPSSTGTMVNLEYRFKGESRWKSLDNYYCGAYDGWHGRFKPIDFEFREDGNYEYIKKEWPKERIISHDEFMSTKYNITINERSGKEKREKEIRSKNTASKII